MLPNSSGLSYIKPRQTRPNVAPHKVNWPSRHAYMKRQTYRNCPLLRLSQQMSPTSVARDEQDYDRLLIIHRSAEFRPRSSSRSTLGDGSLARVCFSNCRYQFCCSARRDDAIPPTAGRNQVRFDVEHGVCEDGRAQIRYEKKQEKNRALMFVYPVPFRARRSLFCRWRKSSLQRGAARRKHDCRPHTTDFGRN
jgi:hypothetical protein